MTSGGPTGSDMPMWDQVQRLISEAEEARAEAAAASADARMAREDAARLRARLDRLEQRRAWQLIRVSDTTPRTLAGWLSLPWRLGRTWFRSSRLANLGGVRTTGAAESKTVGKQASEPSPVAAPVIPRVEPRRLPPRRPDLVVAGVLDPFSVESFRHEFTLVELDRKKWRRQLRRRPPDLLFVESAWRGLDDGWTRAWSDPSGPAADAVELVEWCREHAIPTVFWNKEDPPNYNLFVRSAQLFDWVFTVDAECVPRYRQDLGHDRVRVLPFAAQPRFTNPAAVPGGREYDLAFAGTYFAEKHPNRRSQMDMLLHAGRDFGVHIYSRMSGDQRYSFPDDLKPNVVGSLEYRDMAAAYKRYKVFLNVNSVSTSPSTCSRRVFECLASGTPVVSTPAAAFTHLFGDDPPLVSVRDDDEARSQIELLLRHEELRSRMAVRGLRAVMGGHTYSDRVNELLRIVLPDHEPAPRPLVSAVVCTMRKGALDTIVENLARQSDVRLELVLVSHGFPVNADALRRRLPGLEDVRVIHAPSELTLGAITHMGFNDARGDILTKMDDDDYYAPNYLRDQVAALEYTDADIVGKRTLFAYVAGLDLTVLRFPRHEDRHVTFVAGPTIMMRRSVYSACQFRDIPKGVDTWFFEDARQLGLRVYATDRFNFLYMRQHDRMKHTWTTDDRRFLANGEIQFAGLHVGHVHA